MLEELNISITIDTKNKILYIAEENSSGLNMNMRILKI